jgi:hypothetical protein
LNFAGIKSPVPGKRLGPFPAAELASADSSESLEHIKHLLTIIFSF